MRIGKSRRLGISGELYLWPRSAAELVVSGRTSIARLAAFKGIGLRDWVCRAVGRPTSIGPYRDRLIIASFTQLRPPKRWLNHTVAAK